MVNMMHLMRNSNIIDFIKEVGEPFQFLARKKSIDFNIESDDDKIIAWFDHDALEKIVNNLLSNAFKFTPELGTVNITISKANATTDTEILNSKKRTNEAVIIKVSDTGQGIPKSKTKTIFER